MSDALIYESALIEELIARKEMSAEVWAREFMVAALRTPEMIKDAETMVSVFAGALMVGYDRGRTLASRPAPDEPTLKLAIAALEAQRPTGEALGLHGWFTSAIDQLRAAAGMPDA
jgi:hypothetical protein